MNFWLTIILLGVLFLAGGSAVIAVGALKRYRNHMRALGGDSVSIPATPLQRRALGAMLVTLAGTALILALFWNHGIESFFSNAGLRHRFTGVMVAVMLFNLSFWLPLNKSGLRGIALDERDGTILRSAGRTPAVFLLTLNAFWALALTEIYWDRGTIPIDAPALIFWSSVLAYFLGWSVGVLMGYWRLNTYGQ